MFVCKVLLLLCFIYVSVIVIHKSFKKTPLETVQVYVLTKPEQCTERSRKGDQIYLSFTAFLEDGTEFDSSLRRRGPLVITLGKKLAIEGWNHGLEDMCVGERRKLIIPPHLAFGEEGRPPTIPPQATVIFHFSLVKIFNVEYNDYNENDEF